jgi:hypothetical protein
MAPTFRDWDQVEHSQVLHLSRMIECEAAEDAAASAASGDIEFRESKLGHHFQDCSPSGASNIQSDHRREQEFRSGHIASNRRKLPHDRPRVGAPRISN